MSVALAFVLCATPAVTDGDTIRCGLDAVRIAGIDAPDKSCVGRSEANCRLVLENGTTYEESARKLHNLLKGTTVTVRYYKGTTYGRRIAVVCANKVNVSAYMVKKGFARYMKNWSGAGVRVRCSK